MLEAMNKFEGVVNELVDTCKDELGREMIDMDDRAANIVRLSFKLVDAAMGLIKEQTELMVDMNEKLDKIISKESLA